MTMLSFLVRFRVRPALALAILSLAGGLSGCGERSVASAEQQFLVRRVDELEAKVRDLETKVSSLSGEEPGAGVSEGMRSSLESSRGFDGAGAAIGISATMPAEEFQTKGRIFLLKVKKLETAARSQLPSLLVELGLNTAELDSLNGELNGLEQEKARLAGGAAPGDAALAQMQEKIDKTSYRLQLAAESIRNDLLIEGKKIREQLDAPQTESPGPPESSLRQ